MRKIAGKLAILSLLLGATVNAPAQDEGSSGDDSGRHHGKRMHRDRMGDPKRMIEMLLRHLDLDDTQAQKLQNAVDAAKPEFDELQKRLGENRAALQTLDTTDADYSAKLQNLSASNAELAAQMTLLHGRLRAEVHAVLTPEQQQEMAEFAERRGRQGRRHGEADALH
jgi:Spy/CpxP family protein refolding chaperone